MKRREGDTKQRRLKERKGGRKKGRKEGKDGWKEGMVVR